MDLLTVMLPISFMNQSFKVKLEIHPQPNFQSIKLGKEVYNIGC